MNKKVLFVLVFATSILWASAENKNDKDWDYGKHTLQLDLGNSALALASIEPGVYCGGSVNHDWFIPDTYVDEAGQKVTPAFSLSYYYELKAWLQLGAVVGYAGLYEGVYDRPSGDYLAMSSRTAMTVMPSVNFVYLRRRYVSLYSGVSLGLTLGYTKNYELAPEILAPKTWQCFPRTHFTFLGARFGGRIYGVAELGFGAKGAYTNVGIGCRF